MSRNFIAFFLLICGLNINQIWCKETPSTCKEAMGILSKNGVYLLQLKDSNLPKFYAYCLRDTKNGEPWMIIQRRSNSTINFSRYWPLYQRGFGDLYGDYWLGLNLLHAITHAQRHELWFHMQDFNNQERDAFYNHFIVGDKDSEYELKAVGKFSGNAGDSFSRSVGYTFMSQKLCSAIDPCVNCPYNLRTGGWWFHSCPGSNFNGVYHPKNVSNENGIHWYSWQNQTPLKAVHMAIRPLDDNFL